jgi:group I intron endonuclease
VGSSINLGSRFSIYFSKKAMLNKLSTTTSIIYSALIKHGYDNFSLDILEFCVIDVLVKREQYYIDLLKPKYNILKAANSRLGSKHTFETKNLMSIKQKGVNNPSFGKICRDETRIKISESLKSSVLFQNSLKLRPKFRTDETKLKMSLRTKGVKVKVFDSENNLIKEFPTMISVALHFNIDSRTVGKYLDKNISYNGYTFKSNLVNY